EGRALRAVAERDVHVVVVVGGDAPTVLHALPALAVVDALAPDHVTDPERGLVAQRAGGERVTGGAVDHEVHGLAAGVVGDPAPAADAVHGRLAEPAAQQLRGGAHVRLDRAEPGLADAAVALRGDRFGLPLLLGRLLL